MFTEVQCPKIRPANRTTLPNVSLTLVFSAQKATRNSRGRTRIRSRSGGLNSGLEGPGTGCFHGSSPGGRLFLRILGSTCPPSRQAGASANVRTHGLVHDLPVFAVLRLVDSTTVRFPPGRTRGSRDADGGGVVGQGGAGGSALRWFSAVHVWRFFFVAGRCRLFREGPEFTPVLVHCGWRPCHRHPLPMFGGYTDGFAQSKAVNQEVFVGSAQRSTWQYFVLGSSQKAILKKDSSHYPRSFAAGLCSMTVPCSIRLSPSPVMCVATLRALSGP